MYEYVKGKSMYAKVTSPNTRFEPHKYSITVLTDDDTSIKLENLGLRQVRTRTGELKYDEPAFTFSRNATRKNKNPSYDSTRASDPEYTEPEFIEVPNPAPKLLDVDGNPIDVAVGNGSEVTAKIKPYKNNYGSFAELIAVKVETLVEYGEADLDNEEF